MALVLLQLVAGAVDQHQVEVRVVDRVLHQFVVLVDHSKDRQGSVHRREFLDGLASLLQGQAGSWRE